ncbi:clc-like protein 2 [Prorops nasuta]|uniref:clc-like protein 2 n=1 Tax=Prorops nasuta TaxID=863751 RepID=UPI0034CE76D7
MKKRSLSGNVGIGIFIVAFICVCVAFATASWLVSDNRITGPKLNKLGLWRHCFRSLPNPAEVDAPKRFFGSCRWVYDPFTANYSEIRGFRLPPFMIATQFFFTLCFLLGLISFALILVFTICCHPGQNRYTQLISAIGYLSLASGICGCIAVIIFGCLGNGKDWMPGQENSYLGWSFAIAVIGSILMLIASILFLVEVNVQSNKDNYFVKSHQSRISA